MTRVNHIYTEFKRKLCLVVLYIGGNIDIRTGVIRGINSVAARTAAKSNIGYCFGRVADISDCATAENAFDKTYIIAEFERRFKPSDPADFTGGISQCVTAFLIGIYADIDKFKFFCEDVIHSADCIIKIRVSRVNRNIVSDKAHYSAADYIVFRNPFERRK